MYILNIADVTLKWGWPDEIVLKMSYIFTLANNHCNYCTGQDDEVYRLADLFWLVLFSALLIWCWLHFRMAGLSSWWVRSKLLSIWAFYAIFEPCLSSLVQWLTEGRSVHSWYLPIPASHCSAPEFWSPRPELCLSNECADCEPAAYTVQLKSEAYL